MKLFNQFNVLPRYLTAFNYAGANLKETPKELEKCSPEFQNFWEKECREHPTNQNCLIYCDWVINFVFLLNTISLKWGFPQVPLRAMCIIISLNMLLSQWLWLPFSRYYRVRINYRIKCIHILSLWLINFTSYISIR